MRKMVELRGFEPLTFCMPCSRVSSDGVALGPVPAGHQDCGVRGRRAVAGGIWRRWHLVWHWNLRTPSRRRSQARARVGLMPRAKLAREPGGSRTAPGTSAQGVPGTAARPLITPRNAWSLQAGKISAVLFGEPVASAAVRAVPDKGNLCWMSGLRWPSLDAWCRVLSGPSAREVILFFYGPADAAQMLPEGV